jgi:hypothetical protein
VLFVGGGLEQRAKKEMIFMLGKTAGGKHKMLATSCVRMFELVLMSRMV